MMMEDKGDRALPAARAATASQPSPSVSGIAGIANAADPEWKGGYDRASWIGRYAERMLQAGFEPFEAESWALNAWEASPEDADPDDTAADDLAYAAEDSE